MTSTRVSGHLSTCVGNIGCVTEGSQGQICQANYKLNSAKRRETSCMWIHTKDDWSQSVPGGLSSQHGLLWALSECLRNWVKSSHSLEMSMPDPCLVWRGMQREESICSVSRISMRAAPALPNSPLAGIHFGKKNPLAEILMGKARKGLSLQKGLSSLNCLDFRDITCSLTSSSRQQKTVGGEIYHLHFLFFCKE